MNQMILRKPGRPSVYKFESLEVGDCMEFEEISTVQVERIRGAALGFGRRSGRVMESRKRLGGITITRVS